MRGNSNFKSPHRRVRNRGAMETIASSDPQIRGLTKDYADKHGGFKATELHLSTYGAPKEVELVGPIEQILYVSRKAFEGDDTILFYHDFEGKQPFYATDGHSHHIVSGGYTVTNHGIEDDRGDKRTIPDAKMFVTDLRPPQKIVGMGKMHGLILKDQTEIDLSKKHLILAYAIVDGHQTMFIVPECMSGGCKWAITDDQALRASNPKRK